MVNWDTLDHDQYVRATDALAGLDAAAIPYVIAIGNHDTAATCEGGERVPRGLSGFRQDTGANGNENYQFLYNRHDDTNPVRVVSIDTDANTIDTYVYGPATDEMLDTPGTAVNLADVEWVR